MTYTLTVDIAEGQGSIIPSGVIQVESGWTVAFTADPALYWHFTHWIFNGETITSSFFTRVITSDSIARAYFAEGRPPIEMSIDIVPSELILKQGESGTVVVTASQNSSGRLAITHSGSSYGVTVSPGFLWCENGGSVTFTFTAAPDALSTFEGRPGFWRITQFMATDEFSPWAIAGNCKVWTFPSNGGDGDLTPLLVLGGLVVVGAVAYYLWGKKKK